MDKLKVLFICKDNSIRSQIAAAFLNTYFCDRYEAYCAGVEPSEINPRTVKVMKEIGIDISSHCAKSIEEFRGKKSDCIITLCDYAKGFSSCLPEHKKQLHKSFEDYCIPAFCKIAKECEIRFPGHNKPRHKGHKGLFDSKDSEEKILAAFRCLREEISEWVEKEAAF